MKYKIGQKVVYIGRDHRNHPLVRCSGTIVPVPNKIYTIRGGCWLDGHGCFGYVFDEIVNPVRVCAFTGIAMEMHVDEKFLRPLQERKNDGEAFVAGLRPVLNTRTSGPLTVAHFIARCVRAENWSRRWPIELYGR